jgi:hypothetical protein
MKITSYQLRRIIREQVEAEAAQDEDIDEKFLKLMLAGRTEQAMELAKSLGIPVTDLPWERFGYSQGLSGMPWEIKWRGNEDYEAAYVKGYGEYRAEYAKSMLPGAGWGSSNMFDG